MVYRLIIALAFSSMIGSFTYTAKSVSPLGGAKISNKKNVGNKESVGIDTLLNVADSGNNEAIRELFGLMYQQKNKPNHRPIKTNREEDVDAKEKDEWSSIASWISANKKTVWKSALNTALHYKKEAVQTLVAAGININEVGPDGLTMLMRVAESSDGYIDIVETLLANGAYVDKRGKEKKTALMLAAEQGNLQTMQSLLAHQADINARDEHGNTALIAAAGSRSAKAVQLMLNAGANIEGYVHIRNKRGNSALMKAIINCSGIEVVQTLLAAGAGESINVANIDNHTPLTFALENDKLVKLFIDAGADVNAKILMSAVRSGNVKSVQLLLDGGAKKFVNEPSGSFNRTVLMAAARFGTVGMVEALLKAGAIATINAQDDGKCTALMEAVEVNNIEVLQLLLAHGAQESINFADELKKTPLMKAIQYCKNENNKVIPVLIENGANVHEKDGRGMTTLMLAAEYGNKNAAQELLKAKVNKNEQHDFNDYTALMIAVSENKHDLVQVLIDAKVNIDMQDENGDTALMLAVVNNQYAIVKSLLTAGANFELTNLDGKTALTFASNNLAMRSLLSDATLVKRDEQNKKLLNAQLNQRTHSHGTAAPQAGQKPDDVATLKTSNPALAAAPSGAANPAKQRRAPEVPLANQNPSLWSSFPGTRIAISIGVATLIAATVYFCWNKIGFKRT